jgi:hypothetical protein
MAGATKSIRQTCPDRIEVLTSIKDLARIVPGLLLCVAVAAVAMLLQMVESSSSRVSHILRRS